MSTEPMSLGAPGALTTTGPSRAPADAWAPAGVEVTDFPAASARMARRHEAARAAGQTAAQGWAGEYAPGPGATPTTRAVVPGAVVERHDRPVIPEPLCDGAYLAAAARSGAGRALHALAYHLVRLPLYWCRLALRAPVGLGRLLLAWAVWASDHDGRTVRRAMAGAPAVGTAEASAYARLHAQHRETIKTRCAATGAVLALVAAAALVLWVGARELLPLLGVLAVVAVPAVLGWHGRPAGAVIVAPACIDTPAPGLTGDLVVAALESLGIGELTRAQRTSEGRAVALVAPIHRDGPGWRALVDLPAGVTAAEVIDRRARLASGLRRPEGCVWPETAPGAHAGRLALWVADRPLGDAGPVPWTLDAPDAGPLSLWQPVPLGVDARGRTVTVTLMYAAGLIGATPRMGKTTALRAILGAAALDPRCELHAHDLKGGADLLPLAPVARYLGAGDAPADLDALMADLRAVREDMTRRYAVLRSLPREDCPDARVTDDLASRPALRLHPVMVAVDECQRLFEHPGHRSEAVELVADLVRRGPAAGVMVWLATQRPDAASLPTPIRSNVQLRLCLRVMDQTANDMVLGTGAYASGVRATALARADVGVAMLCGDEAEATLVRVASCDPAATARVVERATALRPQAPTPAGADDQDTGSLLDHLTAVWPADTDRVWWDDLAALLADRYPRRYGDVTGQGLSTMARRHGVPSVQVTRTVDGERANRRGASLGAVEDARTGAAA